MPTGIRVSGICGVRIQVVVIFAAVDMKRSNRSNYGVSCVNRLNKKGYAAVAMDKSVLNDHRQVLNQNQLLGDSRCYAKIEALIGWWRAPKPRGRPRK